MGLKKQFNTIPLPAQGTVPARLARIIEIGQHETFYGVKDQVLFFYSLPTRLIDAPDSEFNGKQGMIKAKPLNMSNNEKSGLVKDHIKVLAPGFDLKQDDISLEPLLRKAMYLTIEHNEDQTKDRTYANIVNTMGVPEGMEVGDLDTTPFYYNFDNPDLDVWTKYLSDFIKEKIQAALNYKGSATEEMVLRLEAMSGGSTPAAD